MEINKRFGKRKKGNSKRGLILVLLLALVIYLFYNIESIMAKFL